MWVTLMMAVSLVLSGCASTGSSLPDLTTSGTADPRLTSSDDAKFFSASGFQACTAVAGVAACGVAMGANYYLDDRRAKYSNTTQRLNAMTADVQQETAKVATRTSTLKRVIEDDKQQIASIQQGIKAKTVDKATAQKDIATIDKNIALMRKDVSNMKARVTEFENVAKLEREGGSSQAEVQKVEAEIYKMNTKVASLQQEVDGLYNQRSAITLG